MIQRINQNFKFLADIDSENHDFKITKNEYENQKNNGDLLFHLTGYRSFDHWNDFKSSFIQFQENEFGFSWVGSRGQGGPLALSEINFSLEVGIEVAKLFFKGSKKEGNLKELLYSEVLDQASIYMTETEFFYYSELVNLREGFKSVEIQGSILKYKPGRNNFDFQKHIATFEFRIWKRYS